ncbi:YfcE family phosphodiesterase [Halobacteriales archaeon QS_1_68_20]|nr:MAG: YfcE family phosphodiesterase [Halobacteriales archaeon QS_1_68_20]
MLVVLSDTHRESGHGLSGPAFDAVRSADRVVHAGDFTAPAVVDALAEEAARLDAVHGNADDPAVRERLPDARVLDYGGVTVTVTHRRDGGTTGLSLFGRSRDADLVVSGHTHRPTVVGAGDVVLLNPGSHADPRGNRPAFAELEPTDGGLRGRLRDVDGTTFERFSVP